MTSSNAKFWKEEADKKDEKKKGFAYYQRSKKKPEFLNEVVELVYLLVGGKWYLSWIPVFGKGYQAEFFILKKDEIKIEANKNAVVVNDGVHLYPYGEVWISDVKTQRYLTELEARRTLENENEVRVNTLKRWVHYDELRSGKIKTIEEKSRVEAEKWERSRDYGIDE